MEQYNTVTLEVSLKPFKQTDKQYIDSVCHKIFSQWYSLLKNSSTVSLMLWSADGSELLDYKGNDDDEFEWSYFVGGANSREGRNEDIDPEGISLHTRNYIYMKNPPVMTYGILKNIVSSIKRIGKEYFPDKKITVGTTFDPGPEFAISDFKYNRHNELCTGDACGFRTMLCAYEKMHKDDISYAGFPDGVSEGLPFGTFFGRQTQIFLDDMGFDFIWFSNGLGFGKETWSTTGAVFDGKSFNYEAIDEVSECVLEFWRLFRKECPNYPIHTRGTNMSVGIDYSTDGVPLKNIYQSVNNLLPPPNSPWAALDGDFGLELMGYMSRIAEVPEERYLFRYYIHDPWWVNSPWYDRYNGKPHDIYLPLAVSRIDENGNVKNPTDFNILSIDNSFGNMPESCVTEPMPHLLKAQKDAPDAVSPVVWVYPFTEYCSCKDAKLLNDMFFEDWFIRNAINDGFPMSSVISTNNFIMVNKDIFFASVLVSVVPQADSDYESAVMDYVKSGGKMIFYGDAAKASDKFRELIGVRLTDGVSGELPVMINGENKGIIKHDIMLCGGEINTVCTTSASLAKAGGRDIAAKGDSYVWVRGTNSADYTGHRLLQHHDRTKYYSGEELLRIALSELGYIIEFDKELSVQSPVIMLSRSDNAMIFSVYSPSTTVQTKLKFPLGAPALCGYEAVLKDGYACYNFPKAEHCECRFFVEQNEGIVGVREIAPVSCQYRRRMEINGLKNATVRFMAESYCKDNVDIVLNSQVDFYNIGDAFESEYVEDENGCYFEIKNVTGSLVCSMPYRNNTYLE